MSYDEAMFSRAAIDVLVIEDDADYLDWVQRVLNEDPAIEFRVRVTTTLREGLELLEQQPSAATLVDLGLPDSNGLKTVKRIVDTSIDTALLVLTAVEDQHVAQEALTMGVQEYLVKGDVSPGLLTRAIRYAVDRQRLLNQLRQAREAESRERELRQIERLSSQAPNLSATAAMYGNQALVEREPERVGGLVEEYGRLLDEALDARVYAEAGRAREDLRSMAAVLGYLGASPRDVVHIHTTALRQRLGEHGYERGQAYLEEGRVTVLELMGYLSSWYRTRAMGAASGRLGATRVPADATASTEQRQEGA